MNKTRQLMLGLLLSASLAMPFSVHASNGQAGRLLIPIGGGYSDVYAGFSAAAVANARGGQVKILVLPTAYSSNPDAIIEGERTTNLVDAENRRFEIEEACKQAAPPGVTCSAVVAPIFTRSDAADPAALAAFSDDLSAVFMLGDNQTVAMLALAGTPAEVALAGAYERDVIVAGTSAGGGMQAVTMLGGYNPNFADGNALNFGAADVWNTTGRRGLPFGIQDAILDQHFFQRGRLGRLLNAIALPDVPHVGVGIDAYTGLLAPEGTRLEKVFGLYSVAVLDAETYHAADAVQYRGPNYTLSLRNVLVHLLAPGNSSYDLLKRQHALGAPAPSLKRTFETLALPKAAGSLLLAGDLSGALEGNPVLARFVELAGGEQARLLIVADGYLSDRSAQANADQYAQALGVDTHVVVVPQDAVDPIQLPAADEYTGIVFIAQDQSLLRPKLLAPLKSAWLSGKPLLADNAAAAAVGAYFSAHGPTPSEAEEAELATQKSFVKGVTRVEPGLKFLNACFEPQVMGDNRWGRLFSLAYTQPRLLAIGLSNGTAVEITPEGARHIGDNAIFVLDLRTAALGLGSNNGFVIANGLLDVFAAGDALEPEPADVDAAPLRAATPALPTITPTPLPTLTPSSTPEPSATPTPQPPTPTPQPSATPAPTTPPPGTSASPLLGWGILMAAIVLALALLLLRARH